MLGCNWVLKPLNPQTALKLCTQPYRPAGLVTASFEVAGSELKLGTSKHQVKGLRFRDLGAEPAVAVVVVVDISLLSIRFYLSLRLVLWSTCVGFRP